jgi:hypothetical protein
MLKKEKCNQQQVGPQANSKLVQHHGDKICVFGNPNYERDGISEIQCTCLKEGEGAKIHHVF